MGVATHSRPAATPRPPAALLPSPTPRGHRPQVHCHHDAGRCKRHWQPPGSTGGTRPGPGPSDKVEGSSSSSRAGRVRDVKLSLRLAFAGSRWVPEARALVSIMVTYRDNAGFTLAGFAASDIALWQVLSAPLWLVAQSGSVRSAAIIGWLSNGVCFPLQLEVGSRGSRLGPG